MNNFGQFFTVQFHEFDQKPIFYSTANKDGWNECISDFGGFLFQSQLHQKCQIWISYHLYHSTCDDWLLVAITTAFIIQKRAWSLLWSG